MSDETVENNNIENNSVQEEKKNVPTEPITLESLANDIAEMKRNYTNELQEKDNEIAALKENNTKLEKTLNEQNTLIGNFRETVFNNAKITPENAAKPNEAHLRQCYEDAYKTAYQWSKHRLIGKNNDENLFISKCMEAYDGFKI